MKIYREEKKELRKPQFRFVGKEMTAVNEYGGHICTLFNFASYHYTCEAKQCLEEVGYSTDWAEWDDKGRMIKLLENFD
jgi:hypothetical protein